MDETLKQVLAYGEVLAHSSGDSTFEVRSWLDAVPRQLERVYIQLFRQSSTVERSTEAESSGRDGPAPDHALPLEPSTLAEAGRSATQIPRGRTVHCGHSPTRVYAVKRVAVDAPDDVDLGMTLTARRGVALVASRD